MQGTKLLVIMAISRSLGRIDDAAAHDAGCIASKAHAHGKGLFAAGMAAFKGFIQVVGNPGKVSGVLQQGEQGKEDGHGRQHHRYNPCQYAVDTQDKDDRGANAGAPMAMNPLVSWSWSLKKASASIWEG